MLTGQLGYVVITFQRQGAVVQLQAPSRCLNASTWLDWTEPYFTFQSHLTVCQFTSLSRTPSCRSDNMTAKLIIDLWPKVVWHQVHLWATSYLNMVIVMTITWLAQMSNNTATLRFWTDRLLQAMTPLQVSPSVPRWALESHSRTMGSPDGTPSTTPPNDSVHLETLECIYNNSPNFSPNNLKSQRYIPPKNVNTPALTKDLILSSHTPKGCMLAMPVYKFAWCI